MLSPEIVQIETTTACNAACIMCPHRKLNRPIEMMSDEVFRLTVKSISQIDRRVKMFMHKEGEPLLDPHIATRIAYIKNNLTNIIEVIMNTNAMLLSEKLGYDLLKSGLDRIYFSVDGATAETYNKIRIGLDYDVVEKNILRFIELRDQLGKRDDFRIVMQMVVNKDNQHEADLFKEKWLKLGCEVYLKRMHCYLDGGASSFPNPIGHKQIDVCSDPFKMVVVLVDGSIGICCWDYNNEYKIGNIKEHSLLELFNNEQFTRLRIKQLQKACFDIVPCNRCRRIFGVDKITGDKISKC